MASVQNLKFLVLANNNNITGRMKNASTNVGNTEIPTLNMSLDNSSNYFGGNTILYPNLPLVLSASLDGGTTWALLFSGSVANKAMEKDNYGQNSLTITANGANSLRLLYLTPNQEVQSSRNIGALMTGTAVGRNNTTWSVTDPKGNYPDGLLYKTGYGLSADSVTDIFATAADIPGTMIYSERQAWEVIGDVAKTFGLMVFVDEPSKTIRLLQDSAMADFPSAAVTLSDTNEISSIGVTDECLEQYNRITVIGKTKDIYFTVGTGSKEKVITDETITSRALAIQKAKQLYDIYASPRKSITVTCTPITASVIGRHVSLSTNPDLGGYGNVVGVKHNISSDRWDTLLTIESPTRTTTKLLAEVKKELTNQKKEMENTSVVFLSAATRPFAGYSAGFKSVVAVGYGDGTPNASIATLSSVRRLKPVKSTVYDSVSNHLYVYAQFDSNDPPANIKEIAFYSNNTPTTSSQVIENSVGEYYKRSVYTGWPYAKDQMLPVSTRSNIYPIEAKSVTGFCGSQTRYYWKKPINISLVGGYKWTASSGADQYAFIQNPTSSWWRDSTYSTPGVTATVPNTQDLINMSTDDTSSWLSSDIPRTGVSVHFAKIFGFDFGIPSDSNQLVGRVTIEAMQELMRMSVTTVSGWVPGTVSLFRWNPRSSSWASLSQMTYSYMGIYSSGASYHPSFSPDWISDDGKVYVAMYAHCEGGDTYLTHSGCEHRIEYLAAMIEANRLTGDMATKTEKATYDSEQGTLQISLVPLRITGVYLTAETNSNTGEIVGVGLNRIQYLDSNVNTSEPHVLSTPMTALMKIPLRDINGKPTGEYTEVPGDNPLFIHLLTGGNAYVTYIMAETGTLPAPTNIPLSNVSMSYSVGSGATAVFYMKNNEYAPPYRAIPSIEYTCIGPVTSMSLIAKLTASAASRVDAGIVKDRSNKINLVLDLDLSGSSSAPTTYSGVGCSAPV